MEEPQVFEGAETGDTELSDPELVPDSNFTQCFLCQPGPGTSRHYFGKNVD